MCAHAIKCGIVLAAKSCQSHYLFTYRKGLFKRCYRIYETDVYKMIFSFCCTMRLQQHTMSISLFKIKLIVD